MAILDTAGTKVVEYKYDAWGRPTGSTFTTAYATLATLNPFRYRGYVWDEETGLYYLRSRYYDPAWGRFVNADNLLGKPGNLFDHNIMAYCANNPVKRLDTAGTSWWDAVCNFVSSAAEAIVDTAVGIGEVIAKAATEGLAEAAQAAIMFVGSTGAFAVAGTIISVGVGAAGIVAAVVVAAPILLTSAVVATGVKYAMKGEYTGSNKVMKESLVLAGEKTVDKLAGIVTPWYKLYEVTRDIIGPFTQQALDSKRKLDEALLKGK